MATREARRGAGGERAERVATGGPRSDFLDFSVLEDRLEQVIDAIRGATFASQVRTVEANLGHWEQCLRGPRSKLRLETRLVVRLEVEGPTSHVPVIWQESARAPWEAFHASLESTLKREVNAAVLGTPLPQTQMVDLVMAPSLSAHWVHECIGHSMEADNFARAAGAWRRGENASELPLTVVDDPTSLGHRGAYTFDDEDAPSRRVVLIDRGVIHEVLHSDQTARLARVASTGHGRRTPGAARALPRMSVTSAEAGTTSVASLISQVEDGLYCEGTFGGGATGLDFVLRPAFARRIRDGQIQEEFVRRFDIIGNKLEALKSLAGIGSDLIFLNPAFGCDKDGQDGLAVTMGAPSLLFRGLRCVPIPTKRAAP